NWYTPYGQIKDMACRTLLLKLQRLDRITLPPSQNPKINSYRNKEIQYVLHSNDPIQTDLKSLSPIRLELVSEKQHLDLFKTFLSLYHYLAYSGTVGENLKYLAFDTRGNPLGCFLFGSAAWKVESRDSFIGWDAKTRKRNLLLITNNMRFLLLPWVRVKYMASHLLGKVAKRISDDWIEKYKHPIHLLETFVEQGRFSELLTEQPIGSVLVKRKVAHAMIAITLFRRPSKTSIFIPFQKPTERNYSHEQQFSAKTKKSVRFWTGTGMKFFVLPF
ncbi:hypothetical protein LCGC14_3130750, partial [marine sediment metagenome]